MNVYVKEVPNATKCVFDTYVRKNGVKVLVEKEVWVVSK